MMDIDEPDNGSQDASDSKTALDAQAGLPPRILLDPLPYMDSYDDNDAEMAAKLIEEEAKRGGKSNHIVFSEKKPEPIGENGIKSYKIPEGNLSFEELQQALNRAKIDYEYNKNRLEVLELQHQYGTNCWMEHNKLLEFCKDRLKTYISDTKNQIEKINIQRMVQQQQANQTLNQLEAHWKQTTSKNVHIANACAQMGQALEK